MYFIKKLLFISEYAFDGCVSLKKITIPSYIAGVRLYTFNWCSSLEEIEIPNTVENIRKHAFHGCISLRKITITSSTIPTTKNIFKGKIIFNNDVDHIIIPKYSINGYNEYLQVPTPYCYDKNVGTFIYTTFTKGLRNISNLSLGIGYINKVSFKSLIECALNHIASLAADIQLDQMQYFQYQSYVSSSSSSSEHEFVPEFALKKNISNSNSKKCNYL